VQNFSLVVCFDSVQEGVAVNRIKKLTESMIHF